MRPILFIEPTRFPAPNQCEYTAVITCRCPEDHEIDIYSVRIVMDSPRRVPELNALRSYLDQFSQDGHELYCEEIPHEIVDALRPGEARRTAVTVSRSDERHGVHVSATAVAHG